MPKFNRFPKSFSFKYKNLRIEFKQSSQTLYFWVWGSTILKDFLDSVIIPFHFESVDNHNVIWSKEEIKRVSRCYADNHF